MKTWARDHAPANDNTTGGRRRWYVLGKRLLLAGLLAAALLGLPAVLLLDRP